MSSRLRSQLQSRNVFDFRRAVTRIKRDEWITLEPELADTILNRLWNSTQIQHSRGNGYDIDNKIKQIITWLTNDQIKGLRPILFNNEAILYINNDPNVWYLIYLLSNHQIRQLTQEQLRVIPGIILTVYLQTLTNDQKRFINIDHFETGLRNQDISANFFRSELQLSVLSTKVLYYLLENLNQFHIAAIDPPQEQIEGWIRAILNERATIERNRLYIFCHKSLPNTAWRPTNS